MTSSILFRLYSYHTLRIQGIVYIVRSRFQSHGGIRFDRFDMDHSIQGRIHVKNIYPDIFDNPHSIRGKLHGSRRIQVCTLDIQHTMDRYPDD